MALFTTLALIGLAIGTAVNTASAAGAFGRPSVPQIPPPRRPPPPLTRPAPPRRTDPSIQGAGAEQRGLFRRRGRATTTLTRGRGAGVRPGPGETRSVLGETIP